VRSRPTSIEPLSHNHPVGKVMTMEATSSIGAGPLAPIHRAEAKPEAAVAKRSKLGRQLSGSLKQRGIAAVLAVASIGALFAFWYLGTKYQLEFYIRFKNVPTPHEVLEQAIEVGSSSAFVVNIVNSVRRILTGFAVATTLGAGLGLVIGKYQRMYEFFMPAMEVLRPIPAIAWVPMSIMLWPNNEASIVFITFIGAFFPILLNTIHGVQTIDRVLLNAGRCLGASELQLFAYIILPGVMPSVFTGLTVGMGVAWVSLIAAEMISGQFGVGYFTWEAYSLVNYPAIVLGMLTIGVLGLTCSGAIRLVGRLVMPWLAYVNGGRK
jgi:NitT/TauT family transport system permease protein